MERPRPAALSELPRGVLWDKTYVARHGWIILIPESWVGSLSHHVLRAGEVFAEVARRWSPRDRSNDPVAWSRTEAR